MGRLVVFLICLIALGCKSMPEDKSAFASDAGQSTIVLGGCSGKFNLGWDQCLLENTEKFKMPVLRFVVTNPAEWAVSDCENGIYKTGSAPKKGLVEVDLSGLSSQAKANRICILKVETIEQFPDPRSKSQIHSIYMRGGFFIELVDPGFFPTPNNSVVAFCVKVMRTTKGRTKIEQCSP